MPREPEGLIAGPPGVPLHVVDWPVLLERHSLLNAAVSREEVQLLLPVIALIGGVHLADRSHNNSYTGGAPLKLRRRALRESGDREGDVDWRLRIRSSAGNNSPGALETGDFGKRIRQGVVPRKGKPREDYRVEGRGGRHRRRGSGRGEGGQRERCRVVAISKHEKRKEASPGKSCAWPAAGGRRFLLWEETRRCTQRHSRGSSSPLGRMQQCCCLGQRRWRTSKCSLCKASSPRLLKGVGVAEFRGRRMQ